MRIPALVFAVAMIAFVGCRSVSCPQPLVPLSQRFYDPVGTTFWFSDAVVSARAHGTAIAPAEILTTTDFMAVRLTLPSVGGCVSSDRLVQQLGSARLSRVSGHGRYVEGDRGLLHFEILCVCTVEPMVIPDDVDAKMYVP